MRRCLSMSVILLLIGCTESQIARRHAALIDDPNSCGQEKVAVSAFALPTSSNSAATRVTDLHGRGQAALIEALHASSPDDLLAQLGSTFAPPVERPSFEQANRFERTVVISIDYQGASPADRIRETRVKLAPEGDAFSFLRWNRFSTDYGTVDLGKISLGHSQKLGLTAAVAPPQAPGASVQSGAELSSTLSEELQLRKRFVVLTGILDGDEAQLIQQGAPGIDLSGNVTVDLSVSVKEEEQRALLTEFSGLRSGEVANSQDKVGVRVFTVVVPSIPSRGEPIRATAELTYNLRRVLDHGNTLIEGDDTVAHCEGSLDEVTFDLLSPEDLRFSKWMFFAERTLAATESQYDSASYSVEVPRRAGGSCDSDERVELAFRSEGQADEFLAWINQVYSSRMDDPILVAHRPVCRCTNYYLGESWTPGACEALMGLHARELEIWEYRVNWERPVPEKARSVPIL